MNLTSKHTSAVAGSKSWRDTLSWLDVLTPEQRALADKNLFVRTVPRGGLVYHEGEPADCWIGIISGLVKFIVLSDGGRVGASAVVGQGGWFGEGSLLKGERHRCTATAMLDSCIAQLSGSTFLHLIDNNAAFGRQVAEKMNMRLGQYIGIVHRDRLLHSADRLAAYLTILSEAFANSSSRIKIQLSQDEIGHVAGMSRQQVNKALKILLKAGIVYIGRGTITVADREALARFKTISEPITTVSTPRSDCRAGDSIVHQSPGKLARER